jgi:predicted aconitase with swiveling domain
MRVHGRVIRHGNAQGEALVSRQAIGFFGGVDPETGVVVETGHELAGKCVSGRILVFPHGKGSTVGSYTLYRLARAGLAPAAIINSQSEAIVAVGAIIGEITMVDSIDITRFNTGDTVLINGALVEVSPGNSSSRRQHS